MNKTKIINYFWNNYQDHIDYTCNVLNVTGLAEDACDHFDLYEGDEYNVPENLYEWASDFEDVLIKRGVCQR